MHFKCMSLLASKKYTCRQWQSSDRTDVRTVSRLTVHLVWATKHRYGILQGDLKFRCRSILMLVCDAEDVEILRGVVSSDHV
ncbi:MAG: hypothetical protein GC178_12970, partial [Flavobacteriales bacterium]|nr:hypothetical protein [Flavobacteriales bacterium]